MTKISDVMDVTNQVYRSTETNTALDTMLNKTVPSKIRSIAQSINFGTSPSSPAGVMTARRKNSGTILEKSGIAPEMAQDVPPEMTVLVEGRHGDTNAAYIQIWAILQDTFSISTKSEWEPFNILGTEMSDMVKALGQAAGASFQTRVSSRRFWKGTEPLELKIDLKFEAYKNALKEVVIPCRDLQKLALPGSGFLSDNLHQYALLSPPGPNPFTIKSEQATRGEIVSIYIGTLIAFESVVVKDISTTYSNRMTREGHPISASTTITFQTYEIYTKEMLDTAYAGGSKGGRPAAASVAGS